MNVNRVVGSHISTGISLAYSSGKNLFTRYTDLVLVLLFKRERQPISAYNNRQVREVKYLTVIGGDVCQCT